MIEGRQEKSMVLLVLWCVHTCSVCSVPVRTGTRVATKKIIFKINSRVIIAYVRGVLCISPNSSYVQMCTQALPKHS